LEFGFGIEISMIGVVYLESSRCGLEGLALMVRAGTRGCLGVSNVLLPIRLE
jgi:hypothetical protein